MRKKSALHLFYSRDGGNPTVALPQSALSGNSLPSGKSLPEHSKELAHAVATG